MLKPETELPDRLRDALQTSFEWIVERDREGSVGDIAEGWAELTASVLDDVRIMAPPIVDYPEPFLPFRCGQTFFAWLAAVCAAVLGSTSSFRFGSTPLDASGGFGVPLIMQKIPSAGRMQN
ncbi:hypothetical protein [Mycoplana dimorpha]|uniref:hypothetical protein n=1 Tax=Mycoplana dimorpha TaxID=28320 RepID=UPI0011B201CA|nr:hypothetical protein [Mycoplana dimorpha]